MKLKVIALTITALLFSVRVFSAPYATTYTGIQTDSGGDPLPNGVVDGESFRVTLVLDNGGATAASQSWNGDDFQCLIFEFNDARNLVWAIDTAAYSPNTLGDQAVTDGAGALTDFFSTINGAGALGEYTDAGFPTPLGNVDYYLNGSNNFFLDIDSGEQVGDDTGGIQMIAANWSAPSPYAGDCVARASASDAPATAVPALPMGGLVILAGLAGLFGARKLRKAA